MFAVLLLFLSALVFEQRVTGFSIYVYSILNFYLIPLLSAVISGFSSLSKLKTGDIRTPLYLQIQLSGFFIVYNVAAYFIFYASQDHIKLLYVPLFYIFFIPAAAKAMWRSIRFEDHWRFFMVLLCVLILFSAAFVQLLYGMLREWWAWILGMVLIAMIIVYDKFFQRLESDIEYRSRLERNLKFIVRLFAQRKIRQQKGGA